MSAPMKIDDEWVEKAARKVARYNWGNEECWQEYQGEAREALSAVAPLIRAKALEEAAQKAVFHEFRDEGEYADGYNDAVSDIASGIRALASNGEKP